MKKGANYNEKKCSHSPLVALFMANVHLAKFDSYAELCHAKILSCRNVIEFSFQQQIWQNNEGCSIGSVENVW